MSLPADPFGRTRVPGDFSREGRIMLLHECFEALVDGRLPSREAALFLGGAGLAWLQEGGPLGSFERDYLKVAAPHRSTLTPARVWRRMGSTARATEGADLTMIDANSERTA